ncbi:MAG: site-specific DNA-methyltransferase [Fimbriimonadaceae bacterium]|nr:site-specific DNA-methyltransferase [Fimbriimonadaceae bacterium]
MGKLLSRMIIGDALTELKKLPGESVNCCVTSPPYWQLRDYRVDGQIGLENDPSQYISKLVAVFREVRRVLRKDGTLWLNLGDTYMSAWACSRVSRIGQGAPQAHQRRNRLVGDLKEKDMAGIPWRVAFALQKDGWYLRTDIIWHKPNGLPERVRDRPTRAHEYLFLFSKSRRYYYDVDAIREPHRSKPKNTGKHWPGPMFRNHPSGGSQTLKPRQMFHPLGRNKRTVWTIPVSHGQGGHFATFPEKLVEPCILAGCPLGGVVLDPFAGTGTMLRVALRLGRKGLGIELNPAYPLR